MNKKQERLLGDIFRLEQVADTLRKKLEGEGFDEIVTDVLRDNVRGKVWEYIEEGLE